LEYPAAVGEAFNVTGPAPFSYDVGAPYVARALGIPCDEMTMPFLATVHLSTAKSRSLLGFVPRYDFLTSVDDAVRMQRGEDIGVVRL
jgi:UDP-glucose 4-epimerase